MAKRPSLLLIDLYMRLLFFSDLHCHNWSEHSYTLGNGLNSRFADCLAIIDQAIDLVASESISAVIFLGEPVVLIADSVVAARTMTLDDRGTMELSDFKLTIVRDGGHTIKEITVAQPIDFRPTPTGWIVIVPMKDGPPWNILTADYRFHLRFLRVQKIAKEA